VNLWFFNWELEAGNNYLLHVSSSSRNCYPRLACYNQLITLTAREIV